MRANQAEFDEIDRVCDQYTIEEARLGCFEPIGS
jgi:hypothetical protein